MWYTRLPPGSVRTWDEMVDGFCSKFFPKEERITFVSLCNNTKQNVNEGVVEFIRRLLRCASTICWEYRLHLKNLNIVQFVDLLQKARRTALTISERR